MKGDTMKTAKRKRAVNKSRGNLMPLTPMPGKKTLANLWPWKSPESSDGYDDAVWLAFCAAGALQDAPLDELRRALEFARVGAVRFYLPDHRAAFVRVIEAELIRRDELISIDDRSA
jgi:hypothetical protein